MADTTNVFDNAIANLSTSRTITSGFVPQTFKNTGNDTSYSLDGTDVVDYFRLRLTRSSSVILSLTDLTANADLELLDSAGNTFLDSLNPGQLADALVSDRLAAGDYYIRVSLPDNSLSTNYTLNVNTISTAGNNLLWRNTSSGQNLVWLMDNNSLITFTFTPTVSDSNWRLETTGDLDGDRSSDYIWRNYATGQISLWLMDGNSFRNFVVMPQVITDPFWRIEGAWDMNNDGQTDLIWRDYNPANTGANLGRLSIWFMNGTSFSSSTLISGANDLNFELSGVNDFNQDGKGDFVWRSNATGVNTIWLMNGLSFSTFTVIRQETDVNWKIVATGDFTGDGKTDLVWRNSVTGINSIWQMNGPTFVAGVNLTAITDTSWSIVGSVNAPSTVDLAGNTMGTAFNIGNLTATGIYNTDTVGNSADRNDYYKFTLTGSSVFNLSLTGLTGDVNVWLVRENSNGTPNVIEQSEILAMSSNTGNLDEAFSNLSLTPGDYFVRIYSPNALTQASPYSLQIGAIPAQQIDLRPTATNALRLTTTSNGTLPATVSLNPSDSAYRSTIRVNYQVENSSAASVTANEFRVRFYLSRDPVITANDFYLGSGADVVVTNLAPNQISSGFRDVTLPPASDTWWGGDQTYYVGMIIDADSQIAEVNESNNAPSVALAIKDTTRPDLVGGGLTVVPTIKSLADGPDADNLPDDLTLRVTGTIKNIGNLATGSNFDVIFYISSDDVRDGSDQIIGFATFNAINAKSSLTFDSSVNGTGQAFFRPLTLPKPTDWAGWRGNGRYYILMSIDPLQSVLEGSGGRENNENYGRLVNQYLDYNFFDVTNFPA